MAGAELTALLAPPTQEDMDGAIYRLLQSLHPNRNKIQDIISTKFLVKCLLYATEMFRLSPTLLEFDLTVPCTVVGDLHGSINDLICVLAENGFPPTMSYLLLGDYVGRGPNQLDVIALLLLLKLRWPKYFHLLRGNHESSEQSLYDTFYEVCMDAYNQQKLCVLFSQLFDYMPLAAIVQDSILCCHGGVSQWMTSRDAIRRIKRPAVLYSMSVLESLLFNDILWADPARHQKRPFAASALRGSYSFNQEGLYAALHYMKCDHLIRGHQDLGGVYQNFEGCITVHTKDSRSDSMRAAVVSLYLDAEGKRHIDSRKTPKDAVSNAAQRMIGMLCITAQCALFLASRSTGPMKHLNEISQKNLLEHFNVTGVAETHFVSPEDMRDWMVVYAPKELSRIDIFKPGGKGLTTRSAFPKYFPVIYDTVKGVAGSYRVFVSDAEAQFIEKVSPFQPSLDSPVMPDDWPAEGFRLPEAKTPDILSKLKTMSELWE